jgi:hypothetical protein
MFPKKRQGMGAKAKFCAPIILDDFAAGLVPGDSGPTRVAAQVVSGIGFLGAGLIFREGASVRGLNTAATEREEATSVLAPISDVLLSRSE